MNPAGSRPATAVRTFGVRRRTCTGCTLLRRVAVNRLGLEEVNSDVSALINARANATVSTEVTGSGSIHLLRGLNGLNPPFNRRPHRVDESVIPGWLYKIFSCAEFVSLRERPKA